MYKLGYTAGVFDLFHIGHLNVVRRAKENCERLVVGVTTDELVFRLKGKYPIIPFEERIDIVRNIKCVDDVYAEATDDKFDALNDLGFDVTFKGDDWKGTPKWLALEKEFAARGVSVVYFPYTQQTSSTKIREIINHFNM